MPVVPIIFFAIALGCLAWLWKHRSPYDGLLDNFRIPPLIWVAASSALMGLIALGAQPSPSSPTDAAQAGVAEAPSLTRTPRPTRTVGPTRTPRPTSSPRPSTATADTEPTTAPEPTVAPEPQTPQEALAAAITERIGPPDPDRPAVLVETEGDLVIVTFSVTDELLISRTLDQMVRDMADIVQTIYGSDYPVQRLSVIAMGPLTDSYGNTRETLVGRIIVPRATYERINWTDYNLANLFDIAEDPFIHPALLPKNN